ncbi:MAG: isoprenylcysteine carboxylmethyltransferase family protein [Parvularculaceae bacterium]|nr:isoprenylcysteine carboxylmethyltransferase family protein [Parvularculaceae bacterium]
MNRASRLLDRAEQAAALILYAFLVQRIWPNDLSAASLAPALVLLSEGVIILFLLIRRPATDISLRPQDWAAAIAGTIAPLLIVKSAEPSNLAVGAFFLLFGMFTQLSAKLSLRRSFGLVAANRGVKTGGAYRYVRHPMYLGYMISHVGFLLMSPTFWNLAVYAIGWSCLVLRVGFEERLLSGDADYRAFKEKVRYRLLPGLY